MDSTRFFLTKIHVLDHFITFTISEVDSGSSADSLIQMQSTGQEQTLVKMVNDSVTMHSYYRKTFLRAMIY